MTRIKTLLLSGAGALAIAVSAHAQTVTQADATRLEAQVQAFFADLMGPTLVRTSPVQMRPAGDHYDVTLPFPLAPSPGAPSPAYTATARPGPNGTWTVENIKATTPLSFTVNVQIPADKEAKTPAKTVPVTYRVQAEGQDGRGVYDPSFATPSTLTQTLKSLRLEAKGAEMDQVTTIGATTSTTTLRPVGDGRVDALIEGALQDYSLRSALPNGAQLNLSSDRVRVNMAMNGVSRERASSLLRTSFQILQQTGLPAAVPGASGGRPTPDVAPALIRAMLDALQDLASSMTIDETLEGLKVDALGSPVTVATAKLGLDARSDKGRLQAAMEFGMDGIGFTDLGLGAMQALIPRQVAIRPSITNVDVAALTRILQAMSEKKDPANADIAAMFAQGGLVTGLDSFSLDMGGAQVQGPGQGDPRGPERGGHDRHRPDRRREVRGADADPAIHPRPGAGRAADGVRQGHRPHRGRHAGVGRELPGRQGARERRGPHRHGRRRRPRPGPGRRTEGPATAAAAAHPLIWCRDGAGRQPSLRR